MYRYCLVGNLLLTLILLQGQGEGQTVCEDISSDACPLLEHGNPNFCSDPSAGSVCPRYCGNCPNKCYSCHDVTDLTQCKQTVQCSKDEVCFTLEVTNFNTNHTYGAGCFRKDLCGAHNPSLLVGRRSDSDLRIHCCDTDMCNGPAYLTTKSSPSPGTTQDACQDLIGGCQYDFCDPQHPKAAQQEPQDCRKTCGLCGSTTQPTTSTTQFHHTTQQTHHFGNCVDHLPHQCPHQSCSGPYWRFMCQRTCNIC